MASFQYTLPSASSSIDAITITQTLTRLGAAVVTTTFTTLATVTLSKSQPTPSQSPQAPSQSIAPSTIGAIVGSILGAILLIVLIYFFCFRSSDNFSESDYDIREVKVKVSEPRPMNIERRGDEYVYTRPPRRPRRAPMDSARSPSHLRSTRTES